LNRLAARKVGLRRRMAIRREEGLAAARCLAAPFELLDRVLVLWRKLPPLALLAAVPLGLLVRRSMSPRLRFLRLVLRWGPLVAGALRSGGNALGRRFPFLHFFAERR
jgi:hypothetical protein